jgi:hypothetical protein
MEGMPPLGIQHIAINMEATVDTEKRKGEIAIPGNLK